MGSHTVVLYPVSFALEDGPPRMVCLARPGVQPLLRTTATDAEAGARALLTEVLDLLTDQLPVGTPQSAMQELKEQSSRFLELVGADRVDDHTVVIYTSVIPMPLAEEALRGDGAELTWRTLSQKQGTRDMGRPDRRTGPDAVVLDYWRQAFEETDFALDFLPQYLSLLQLRGLYEAVWGYDQDPSGFRRWAIDRTGAFSNLLAEVDDEEEMQGAFFKALADRLSPADAAKAGAMTAGAFQAGLGKDLSLSVGLAAAASVNRLYPRRGPSPTWFRKTSVWRPGPTWIDHLYPPRPNWTRWRTDQFVP